MMPDDIEALLRDFRAWLTDLTNGRSKPVGIAELTPDAGRSPETVDLFTLVGQFTALRHEVNLQTKAARAAVEQNAEVLQHLAEEQPQTDNSEQFRPLLKALLDISDALALSLRQMEKFRDSVEPLLADIAGNRGPDSSYSPKPGFFARLFARSSTPSDVGDERSLHAAERLQQLASAAADGYALSLRRVERVLPSIELEPIVSIGEPFDPELMEVVDVVAESGQSSGIVVEEVRPGYRWRGKVFRFAQVKVAR